VVSRSYADESRAEFASGFGSGGGSEQGDTLQTRRQVSSMPVGPRFASSRAYGPGTLGQPQFPGPLHGIRPAVDAQLAVDVLDVKADGVRRDAEPFRDLGAR
jgi:hypothetical protein